MYAGRAGRAAVRRAFGSAVRTAVRTSVRRAFGSAVRTSVGASVATSVRSAVGAAVRTSVGAAVRTSVRSSVVDVGCAGGTAVRRAFLLVRVLLGVRHVSS
ncbi:hypothetical protein ACFQ6B_07615 [Streptomyces wedmorensis]|uniref:Uncharacterized protein n=1 Tax=Streptomyces wedmorensis TaxID=43759 RepID=A0ABW6INC6_STRWE